MLHPRRRQKAAVASTREVTIGRRLMTSNVGSVENSMIVLPRTIFLKRNYRNASKLDTENGQKVFRERGKG